MLSQIHQGNPDAIVTVGISTVTPGGRGPNTAETLMHAVLAADPLVSGYWLNVVGDRGALAKIALRMEYRAGPLPIVAPRRLCRPFVDHANLTPYTPFQLIL